MNMPIKPPFSMTMTKPRFAQGLAHALGQLVEHAGENVDFLSIRQVGGGGLELNVKISGVDWDNYQIGDLRQRP
jgi:hypothetical protein